MRKVGIQYFLRENPFKDDGRFIANSINRGNIGMEDLIMRMVKRGTTLTEIDLSAVLMLFRSEIIRCLAEGTGVNVDDFFVIRPSVSGYFNSREDNYDPKRHRINAKICASRKLIKQLSDQARLEKISQPNKDPHIMRVHDQVSDTYNKQMTIGYVVMLKGQRLAFNREAEDEGVFLLSSDYKRSMKINYMDVIANNKLRIIIPQKVTELGDEIYIEVRTRGKTKYLGFGRTGFSLKPVAAPQLY